MNTPRTLATLLLSFVLPAGTFAADWKPAKGPLFTRWAKDVNPQAIESLHKYPRMQLQRPWHGLNGLWDYAIRPKADARPGTWDGQILVPFPIESALSGVMKRVGPDNRLWYRTTFRAFPDLADDRVLLNFGAVDWETTVWVNGMEVGRHRGGYDPIALDITAALRPDDLQELVVSVWDPTNASYQPVGKQHNSPHGIWYTPSTGIWQTVWLERVPPVHIRRLKLVPDVDAGVLRVTVETNVAAANLKIDARVHVGDRFVVQVRGPANVEFAVRIPTLRLWSPDTPFLYDLEISLLQNRRLVEQVQSYFAMRKISLGPDEHGVTRILLNNKPLFQFGPLDQGFWPDGLYTAPTDDALRYDIEVTKQLGCNMIRKHVKVEPDRWYYWCDKLGMLVWQDMPNGDAHVAPGKGEIERSKESAENYEREWKAIIDARCNHPCIVMWVPFNEGWGQYETRRIVEWTKRYDPSRLVNCASGWNDVAGVGDVHDIHVYPGPGATPPEPARAAVLGEFGGLGLPLRGHTWQDEKNWGYRSYTSREDLTVAYVDLIHRLRPLVHRPGLSAAVYTQTTDVEIEVNGLLTYDRELIKPDAEAVKAASRKLYLPPPKLTTVVPTSATGGIEWLYTTKAPPANWYTPDFDARAWQKGPGGFGSEGTPGAVVRTPWKGSDIWIRRTVTLDRVPAGELQLLMHHDEDAEVYINGQLAAKVTGYTTDYATFSLTPSARASLHSGANTLAVHCKQTDGGQYIDVGLVEVVEATVK